MFSQTAEYALRAMVSIARQPGHPMTTAQIAKVTLAPPGYLSKVLQMLVRARLIHATRGLYGGYQLARMAGEISILDVVNAVDPIKRIHNCPLGIKEHGNELCPLHRRLDEALARIESTLNEVTLAEVLAEPAASSPLCAIPGADAPDPSR